MILWYQEKPKQGPASYLPAHAGKLATEVSTNRKPTCCSWGSQWNFMDIKFSHGFMMLYDPKVGIWVPTNGPVEDSTAHNVQFQP